MIFAAGLGTRMQPLTLHKPKALVEVAGIPLLEIAIRRLKWFGYTHIVVNVHYLPEQILDFLARNQNFGVQIIVSDERDLLLDTGGGLLKAAPHLAGNEPVLVCNADVLCTLNLHHFRQFHLQHQQQPLATLAVQRRTSGRYLLFNRRGQLCGWENTASGQKRMARPCRQPQQLAFCGIQLIQPQILELCTLKGVFSVIDLYLQIAGKHPIQAYLLTRDQWLDVGKPDVLPAAAALLPRVLPHS